jgi:hypothetical protein
MMKARKKRDRVGCCFHDRESSESMSEKSLNFSSSQRVVREESVGHSMGGEVWSDALLARRADQHCEIVSMFMCLYLWCTVIEMTNVRNVY